MPLVAAWVLLGMVCLVALATSEAKILGGLPEPGQWPATDTPTYFHGNCKRARDAL